MLIGRAHTPQPSKSEELVSKSTNTGQIPQQLDLNHSGKTQQLWQISPTSQRKREYYNVSAAWQKADGISPVDGWITLLFPLQLLTKLSHPTSTLCSPCRRTTLPLSAVSQAMGSWFKPMWTGYTKDSDTQKRYRVRVVIQITGWTNLSRSLNQFILLTSCHVS